MTTHVFGELPDTLLLLYMLLVYLLRSSSSSRRSILLLHYYRFLTPVHAPSLAPAMIQTLLAARHQHTADPYWWLELKNRAVLV